MTKRVTIYDIASKLNISTSTVSRVLNGSSLISPELSKTILKTAKELGYKNRLIKRHAQRAILNIILVLPDRPENYLNLFYDVSDLISGIKKGAKPSRIHLVTELEGRNMNFFKHKKSGHIDGVIFAFTKPTGKIYKSLADRQIPSLTLNRTLSKYDFISCDNQEGMLTLIEYFKNQKSDLKPCFVTLDSVVGVSKDRETGFRSACKTMNIKLRETDIYHLKSMSCIDKALIKKLKNKGYNAICCVNDIVACYLQPRLDDEHILLSGFDDSPVRQLCIKAPSTISLPVNELGREAGKWIVERIINKSTEKVAKQIAGSLIK